MIWRRSTRLLLNGVELRDAPNGLAGDRGPLGPVDAHELAPDMGHAGDLADLAGAVEVVEPGIAVHCPPLGHAGMPCQAAGNGLRANHERGMHPAAISGQMIRGMPAFAIGREAIPAGGRSIAARCAEGAPLVRRPLVAAIGPQPRRHGLAGAPSRRLPAIACPLPDRAFPMPEKGATDAPGLSTSGGHPAPPSRACKHTLPGNGQWLACKP